MAKHRKQRFTKAAQVRNLLLASADEILRTAIDVALGNERADLYAGDIRLLSKLVDKVCPKIDLLDDKQNILLSLGIQKNTPSFERADKVLDAVFSGKLSPLEASSYVSMLNTFFTAKEMRVFAERIEQLSDRTEIEASKTEEERVNHVH